VIHFSLSSHSNMPCSHCIRLVCSQIEMRGHLVLSIAWMDSVMDVVHSCSRALLAAAAALATGRSRTPVVAINSVLPRIWRSLVGTNSRAK
jgi:hypothetical protein